MSLFQVIVESGLILEFWKTRAHEGIWMKAVKGIHGQHGGVFKEQEFQETALYRLLPPGNCQVVEVVACAQIYQNDLTGKPRLDA